MTRGRIVASLLAAALVAAAVVVAGFGGRLWFPLDALGHFRLHAGAAALILGMLAARRGARVAGAAAAVVGLAGIAALGPAWRDPGRPAAPGPTREVVVAVANLYLENAAHASALAALAALGADLVVTLETPAAAIDDDSPLRKGFATFAPRSRSFRGASRIWTDLPVVEAPRRKTGDRPAPGARSIADGLDLPSRVRARVDLGEGATLDVLGLHFRRPVTQNQERQIAGLAEALPPLGRPLVVVGDFNAAPWSVALARVQDVLGVRLVGGLRPTWRPLRAAALDPLAARLGLPIDHVLVSEGVGVVSVETFAIPGSDHRGVLARLRVPLAPPT